MSTADAFSPRLLILAVALTVGVLMFLRGSDDHATGAGVRPAQPVRLVVPALDLDSRVAPIEVDTSGVLYPPDDVDVTGWWKRSAKPGAHRGQTVLTGHTVSTGGGVMDRLDELRPGDRVRVRTPKGVVRYETTRVRTYSRAELAHDARRLFGQKRSPRLVLITCTDWDGAQYRSNTVAFAELSAPEPVPAGSHPDNS
ncbi:MAG TPA: class F sortase [Nocardioides sp.]|uniref:class F sortase n=1 Tax=Nocardioides sp. TaxID=35761 RepID=UPI002D7E9302|nr:class F sortase [Nocardioides sp.]HET6651789.1 class F sortase [Nocardioides sp.]